jgi:RNA polymerase nonessential primary-like sigma factor
VGRKKNRKKEVRKTDKPRPRRWGKIEERELLPVALGPHEKASKEWEIALKNQLLVHKILRKEFRWLLEKQTVLDYEDLFQIGMMGLHHSIELFNPKLGFKLSTYAYVWIKQYVSRAARDEGFRCVRVPVIYYDRLSSLRKRYGPELDIDQLRNQKKIGDAEWKALQVLSRPLAVEFDAPVNQEQEDGATFADFVLFHENNTLWDTMEHLDVHAIVIMLMSKLPARQREVLELRYAVRGGEELSHREIALADKSGVSHQRIQQIEKKAIEYLKRKFQKDLVLLKDVEGILEDK